MRLISLGSNPVSRCFVLEIGDARIMLDCGSETEALEILTSAVDGTVPISSVRLLVRTPPLELSELESIDAVLLSSYRKTSMGAVPLLVQDPSFPSTIPIFATAPTASLGILHLSESSAFTTITALESGARDTDKIEKQHKWRIIEHSSLGACATRIRTVRYRQDVRVRGDIWVTPLCAGNEPGSANWIIRSTRTKERFVYLRDTAGLVGQQQFTHRSMFLPADITQDCGARSGVYLLASSPHSERSHDGDSAQTKTTDHLRDLFDDLERKESVSEHMTTRACCEMIVSSLKSGGRAMVQASPSTVAFRLIDAVADALDAANMRNVAINWVCCVARRVIAVSDSLTEFLSEQERRRVGLHARSPFRFDELIRSGRLRIFDTAADLGRENVDRDPTFFPALCFTSLPLETLHRDVSKDHRRRTTVVPDCWHLASGPLALQRAALTSSFPSGISTTNLLLRIWESERERDVPKLHTCAECSDWRVLKVVNAILRAPNRKDDDESKLPKDALHRARALFRHVLVARSHATAKPSSSPSSDYNDDRTALLGHMETCAVGLALDCADEPQAHATHNKSFLNER